MSELVARQIKQADDAWSVEYHGVVVMQNESYQVTSNVAHFLNFPEQDDNSECAVVAYNIRQAYEQMSETPIEPSSGSSPMFQINESDLCYLEAAVAAIHDQQTTTSPGDRVRWTRVKQILSDVRWNYGPYEQIEKVPDDES